MAVANVAMVAQSLVVMTIPQVRAFESSR